LQRGSEFQFELTCDSRPHWLPLNQQIRKLLGSDRRGSAEADSHQLEHNEQLVEFQIARREVRHLKTITSNNCRDVAEIREASAAALRVSQRKVKRLMAANQNQLAQAHLRREEQPSLGRGQQRLADPEQPALLSDSNDLQLESEGR
jgi:hypothetical protein